MEYILNWSSGTYTVVRYCSCGRTPHVFGKDVANYTNEGSRLYRILSKDALTLTMTSYLTD
jgi:hypothetical protein